jgi:GNAT superfamily N-acetyltransferase
VRRQGQLWAWAVCTAQQGPEDSFLGSRSLGQTNSRSPREHWLYGMNAEFTTLTIERPGTIATLLRASYADLLRVDPRWESELANWDDYDREVFARPKTVGACLFLTRLDKRIVGFGSWDPRQRPAYGIVGHNCILPEFRGRGLGRQQIQEILLRFQRRGIKIAKTSTSDHPFFVPAQRMYSACGFREVRRFPWDRDLCQKLIEYEKEISIL